MNPARQDSGQTIIETAVVLPTFLLLLFGIFLFSMALTGYINAAYAVRAGARYASVHSSTSISPASTTQVSNVVKSQIFMPGTTSSTISVTYSNAAGGASATNVVGAQVLVGITWSQTIKLPGFSRTISMGSQAYRFISR